MKKTAVFIFIFSILSFQSFAQEWGTIFPTDKEIAEMDRIHAGKKIIVENQYYPKAGKFNEVLALRIAASKLMKKSSLTSGRVIVTRQTMDRSNGKQEEIAAVVWHSEYENLASLKKELNSYTTEQEIQLKEIQGKMRLLVNRFKRTSSYVVFDQGAE